MSVPLSVCNYKKVYGLIDFTDMIQKFLDADNTPNFDVIFVDEAQDLSLIQWSMINKIEKDINFYPTISSYLSSMYSLHR